MTRDDLGLAVLVDVHGGARRLVRERGAPRGGDEAVDAGGAAVADDLRRLVAVAHARERLEVAHRPRRRGEQQRAGVEDVPQRARDVGAGEARGVVEALAHRRAGARVGREPGVEPGVVVLVVRRRRLGDDGDEQARVARGVGAALRVAVVGDEDERRLADEAQHRAAEPGRADHDDDLGQVRGGELRVGEQQGAVRDRGVAAARVAARLAEQRPAAGLGERDGGVALLDVGDVADHHDAAARHDVVGVGVGPATSRRISSSGCAAVIVRRASAATGGARRGRCPAA